MRKKFGLGKTIERDVIPQIKSQPRKLTFGYEVGSYYTPGYYGPKVREGRLTEDWMIRRGTGIAPVVIREVQSPIQGMKRYALIEWPEKIKIDGKTEYRYGETNATVSYAYSEGIDMNKMVEDAEYAQRVRELLQPERLREKKDRTVMHNADIVYIGSVIQEGAQYRIDEEKEEENFIKLEGKIEKRQQEEAARRKARKTASRAKEMGEDMWGTLGRLVKEGNEEELIAFLTALFWKIGPDKTKEILGDAIGIAAVMEREAEFQKNNTDPKVTEEAESHEL